MALVVASDGLPAREVHEWSDEKLFYVERYMDIFTIGMRDKWRLAYVDLFSGPGLCVEQDTRRETLGSPLRAIKRENFGDLFFNDIDPGAIDALERRLEPRRPGITITNLDCNAAAAEVRERVFAGHERETLGLAFIDPTAFQMRFDSLRDLTRGLRMDLIITFMTGYIRRGLELGSNLDAFMGTTSWRGTKTNREILDLYARQLRSIGYLHVDDDIRITNSKESTLYHLVFASKNPLGAEFFKRISRRKYDGQHRML